ncbi:MAG TPA: Holliday junction resolvase RuvX [Flavobacterium sp.]|nr:Holliday junction resolvase RuvX [Flavobacterium sp.]
MNTKSARILAIDYGAKRTGLAVTDPLQIIASGLATVATDELFDFLNNYFQQEGVSKVIIGMPKRLNNEPSEIAPQIEKFITDFQQKYPNIPIETRDERFTSKIAFQSMIDNGMKKKQRKNKGLVDEIAATILLQDYLTEKMF